MNIAICVWGERPMDQKSINYWETYVQENHSVVPTIFNQQDTDRHRSLWLTNNLKRQHELKTLTLFDIVLYIRSDISFKLIETPNKIIYSKSTVPVVTVNKLPKMDVKPHTVYYSDNKFIVFYCDSMAGDLASLYTFNMNNRDTVDEDFKHHLLSYRLNTKGLMYG